MVSVTLRDDSLMPSVASVMRDTTVPPRVTVSSAPCAGRFAGFMCMRSTSRAGHLAALDALVKRDASFVVNLGADLDYSVLDVVQSFEQTSGRPGAV
jgi:hypothetical protein